MLILLEVNERRRKADERFDAFVRLAEPHGCPSEHLGLLEKALGQATPLMHLLVIIQKLFTAGLPWDDRTDFKFLHVLFDAIGVVHGGRLRKPAVVLKILLYQ